MDSEPATTTPADAPAAKRPSWLRRMYDWTLSWADRPHGTAALFVIAFMESSFFPIPPDILLVALCVGNPDKAWRKAFVCTAGSVLGGIFGYGIGWGAWHSVRGLFIPHVFSQDLFDMVEKMYQQNAFMAILSAAFTPIPYKVFTVAGGVFEVSLVTLIVASIIGRGARFFLVAGLIRFLGPKVKDWIERYFDWFAWGVLLLGVLGFVAIKWLH